MIMQTKIKGNDRIDQFDPPPVPPPAHFDEREIARAKQVQPLAGIRKQPFAGQRRSVMALIVVGLATSVALADAFINLSPAWPAERVDNVESPSQALAPPATEEVSSTYQQPEADSVRTSRRRSRSSRRWEWQWERPAFGLDDTNDDGKPKARLVDIIH